MPSLLVLIPLVDLLALLAEGLLVRQHCVYALHGPWAWTVFAALLATTGLVLVGMGIFKHALNFQITLVP